MMTPWLPCGGCWRRPARSLDIEPDRIVVGGASAGGGLAAAATVLAACDEGLPVARQVLFYAMLDDRQQTPSSRWDAPVWPPVANEFGWRSYLGDLYKGEVPPYAAPARRSHVGGLPPFLVIVGGADGFFDENLDYATQLTRAGIPTDLRFYAGAPHGLDLLAPEASASRSAIRDAEQWLSSKSNPTGN
jgi:acetyl esterase/lipase